MAQSLSSFSREGTWGITTPLGALNSNEMVQESRAASDQERQVVPGRSSA